MHLPGINLGFLFWEGSWPVLHFLEGKWLMRVTKKQKAVSLGGGGGGGDPQF
jgi:hypothetical protein